MAESPITVLIADDQQLVRRGFRVILEAEPDIRVVAEAGDGREAVEVFRQATGASVGQAEAEHAAAARTSGITTGARQ